MSAIRPPGLGPVIGHTTHESCRLWIQASDTKGQPGTAASDRRTLGVIGLLSDDRKEVREAYYFRLHREFDRTGTFVVGKDVALGRYETDDVPADQRGVPVRLEPDTRYTVRMGTITLDDPGEDGETVSDVELAQRVPPIEHIKPQLLALDPDRSEATFRTFPANDHPQDELAFLLGSCRYPGLLWKVKEADTIFGPMLRQVTQPRPGLAPRFALMVGDQIYADALNRHIPIARADTYEEFQERYQTAFSSPNMRRLLRALPSYMILDDHEIEDNWSQDRLRSKHQLFSFAIGAYRSYQWSHSPRSFGPALYYQFDCAGYPFFVLDGRTQRFKDDREDDLTDNHLLGRPTIDPLHPGQLKRFLEWLSHQQEERGNVPKFVASASVFAPNPMDERIDERKKRAPDMLYKVNRRRRNKSDSWPCYPDTRRAVLDHIAKKKIQNVVFLSGDIHCSNIARLEFERSRQGGTERLPLSAYDITSSALYWPFPLADGDPNGYVHDSRDEDQLDPFPIAGGEMNYRAWAFTQEDNFCRIEVDRPGRCLRVRYFDRKGRVVRVSGEDGQPTDVNVLELAPWE